MPDGAGLAADAAAHNSGHDVHLAVGIGGIQRLTDHHLQGVKAEILVDIAAVDGDGAGSDRKSVV